jgi:hypothetical protein
MGQTNAGIPILSIGGAQVPLLGLNGVDAWSFVNLILVLIGAGAALVFLAITIIRDLRNDETDEFADAFEDEFAGAFEDDFDKRFKNGAHDGFNNGFSAYKPETIPDARVKSEADFRKQDALVAIVSLGIALISSTIFILIEDTHVVMVLFDSWTPLFAILLFVELILILVGILFHLQKEENESV